MAVDNGADSPGRQGGGPMQRVRKRESARQDQQAALSFQEVHVAHSLFRKEKLVDWYNLFSLIVARGRMVAMAVVILLDLCLKTRITMRYRDSFKKKAEKSDFLNEKSLFLESLFPSM